VKEYETSRAKAHRLLDDWIDGKLYTHPMYDNDPAIVNLGHEFKDALDEAKRKQGK
jgi:hypothetical protein